MECFEFRTRLSDFLDGPPQAPFEEHSKSCKSCQALVKHVHVIRTELQSPQLVKESGGVQGALSLKSGKSRSPLSFRLALELVGGIALIVFVVSVLPRLIATQQKSIDETIESLDEHDPNPQTADLQSGEGFHEEYFSESGTTEDNETPSQPTVVSEPILQKPGENLKVGDSEIWRFMIRTDSPRDLRAKVIEVIKTSLAETGATSAESLSAKEAEGTVAPGGILFNFMISKSAVVGMKERIEKLVQSETPQSSAKVDKLKPPFTWYKKKVAKEIPAGKTRVVIWLSQS